LWLSHCFLHSATPTTTPKVPEVTPNFCGTLSLGDLGSVYFFEALAKLPLRFSTIKLKDYHCHGEGAYELLLNSCRDTLVALHYMHIYRGTSRVCPGFLQRVLTISTLQIRPSQTSR
jgi:hypothetical protein